MQFLLTTSFWKGVWIWCKANWKFLLGISIPLVLSIVLRRGKMISVLKKGIEARDKLIETERQAAGLETSLKDQATDDFVKDMRDIQEKYDKDLAELEEKRSEAENLDLTPDQATEALADKFNLRKVDDE